MKKWKVGMMLSTIGIFSLMNPVQAQEGNGNKIHFINVSPTNLGSDAILLESNGHYAMIREKTMIFQMIATLVTLTVKGITPIIVM